MYKNVIVFLLSIIVGLAVGTSSVKARGGCVTRPADNAVLQSVLENGPLAEANSAYLGKVVSVSRADKSNNAAEFRVKTLDVIRGKPRKYTKIKGISAEHLNSIYREEVLSFWKKRAFQND